jgi:membrane protease YdiL (CAAX protease family)
LLAAALLTAEYVLALLVFDSERLPIAGDTKAFAFIGESMPLIIVVMTATLLIGGGPSKAEMTEISAAFRERRRTWPLFVGHLQANPETVDAIPNALAEMPGAAAAFWLFARVLGSVVVVPVAEELAFRGYLLRRLIDADFTAVSPKRFTTTSFLISSVLATASGPRRVPGRSRD